MKFKKYMRTDLTELAAWHEGFDMTGVSVSQADRENGSPKLGDKIARNPNNHKDKWLIAAQYFKTKFAPYDYLRRYKSNTVKSPGQRPLLR